MPKIRVRIDPKVRIHGQLTFAGFDDVDGNKVPKVGESVIAFHEPTGAEAAAVVTDRLEDAQLLYLGVAWREFPGEIAKCQGLTLP